MSNNSMLQGMGGWSQFFFFWFLFFFGITLTISITTLVVDIDVISTSARTVRMSMMIQTIGIFLFPAFCFAFFCEESPKVYLKINPIHNLQLLALAVLLTIFMQPTVEVISYYNQQMVLPESMSAIEQWMKEAEENALTTLKLILSDKSIVGFISNVLIIAVVAGLAEELFFRGCLQQIIGKIVSNKHAMIWIAAFIFSFIHFQFYGFAPRMLLGGLLGYLFVWSNSIWLPVLVHTLHNAINVVIPQLYYGTPKFDEIQKFDLMSNLGVICFSFTISVIVIILLYRKRVRI